MVLDLTAVALRGTIEYLESIDLMLLNDEQQQHVKLVESLVVFSHFLAEVSVVCASAAYTASIQHFERKSNAII